MVFVDVDYSFVGDVRSDNLFGVLEVQHFEQHETVHHFFSHRFFPSDPDFFDFVGVLGM